METLHTRTSTCLANKTALVLVIKEGKRFHLFELVKILIELDYTFSAWSHKSDRQRRKL